MSAPECPSESALRQLCDGLLDQLEELEIYRHIDQCESCQRELDRLTDTAGFQLHSPVFRATPDSALLAERLRDLKAQGRPAVESGTRHFKDLSPWFAASGEGIGQVDEYELRECIGRGGMGVVFRAYDTTLTRDVALKMMSPALLADPTAPERFLREARSAARINHPNVVTLYAVSEVRELPYIAMEFVEGRSLQHLCDEETAFGTDETIAIAQQVAAGLDAAHRAGVVHRDVKPANILIDSKTGLARLTDFGLARCLDGTELTMSGFFVGTPEFVAPEQIESVSSVDHRADLFSLGGILYLLATGRSPFAASSPLAALNRVCHHEPPPVRSLNAAIPDWLDELIQCLLMKAPNARPESAGAVLQAIEDRNLGGTARPRTGSVAGRRDRDARPLRTSPGKRAWFAIGVCVLAFLLAFGWRAWSARPTRVETAGELLDLCDRDPPTDLAMVLTSSRPYRLEPLFFEGRSVTITAAEGVEPKLIFEVDEIQPCLEMVEGEIELSGITIEVHLSDTAAESLAEIDEDELEDPDSDDFEDEDEDEGIDGDEIGLISCEDGSLTASNCRLVSEHFACVRTERSNCELLSCDLIAIEATSLQFVPASGDTLSLFNCLLVGEDNIRFPSIDDIAVEILNSTFIGDVSISLEDAEPSDSRIRILSQHNIFDAKHAALFVDDLGLSNPFAASGVLHWDGESNLYPPAILVIEQEASAEPTSISLLSRWRNLTRSTESNSQVATPFYSGGRSQREDGQAPRKYTRADLEVAPQWTEYGIQKDWNVR